MSEATRAYVVIHDCGNICAAVVDDSDYAKETAKNVAGWIRKGRSVEAKPLAEVRKAQWCRCFR